VKVDSSQKHLKTPNLEIKVISMWEFRFRKRGLKVNRPIRELEDLLEEKLQDRVSSSGYIS
jgi:hypothetical protein